MDIKKLQEEAKPHLEVLKVAVAFYLYDEQMVKQVMEARSFFYNLVHYELELTQSMQERRQQGSSTP